MKNKAWEKKLKDQTPGLRRYARALTQDATASDDLVQDCLTRAWEKRDSWAEGSNLRAWLFSIMHNLFINNTRRQKLHQNHVTSATTDTIHHSHSDTMLDLEKCLAKLKPETREILLLAGLENLSYKEIAVITESPVGTVMSRLSRGREELRNLMSDSQKPKLVSIK